MERGMERGRECGASRLTAARGRRGQRRLRAAVAAKGQTTPMSRRRVVVVVGGNGCEGDVLTQPSVSWG